MQEAEASGFHLTGEERAGSGAGAQLPNATLVLHDSFGRAGTSLNMASASLRDRTDISPGCQSKDWF